MYGFSYLPCYSARILMPFQKAPYVFPIIGGRKIEHLQANLEALDISLTPEHIKALESVLPFDPGFPNTMIVRTSPTFASRKTFL